MNLKSCPFCGGTEILVEDIISRRYETNKGGSKTIPYSLFIVKCNSECVLEVKTLLMNSKKEAMAAWNRRK